MQRGAPIRHDDPALTQPAVVTGKQGSGGRKRILPDGTADLPGRRDMAFASAVYGRRTQVFAGSQGLSREISQALAAPPLRVLS